MKGDNEALSESKTYLENKDIFNHYLKCVIEFGKQFDPSEIFMII